MTRGDRKRCALQVYTAEALEELNGRGDRLRADLNTLSQQHGSKLQWTGRGSMLMPHFVRGDLASFTQASRADPRLKCASYSVLMLHQLSSPFLTLRVVRVSTISSQMAEPWTEPRLNGNRAQLMAYLVPSQQYQ